MFHLLSWGRNGPSTSTRKGGLALCSDVYPNIVYWSGLSEAGADAMKVAKEQLRFAPTPTLTYLIDGTALDMPLAKKVGQYKKPHWLSDARAQQWLASDQTDLAQPQKHRP